MRLEHQVALITGASHGLGLAIARSLAAEGAAIACVARPGPELDRAVAELRATGSPALAAAADVTRADEVERAVQATLEQWGRLDIVVLNAGTWQGAPLHETSEAQWDLLLGLNLKGAFLTLKHALPALIARRRGTIVGISSLGGLVGQPGSAAYAASKWGLHGLLESVALEVKPHRVRVSVVHPHQMNSAGRAIEPGSAERDRAVEPVEVAAMVAFVCTAPEHVAIGNVTVWPLAAGIGDFMQGGR
jgi:NAD(P)-dependent dehydrogenase (short-subunit alcohol dehydrogenase family)